MSGRNIKAPPKSYWNNLQPGPIPQEIEVLTQAEQRLLSRIIPFVKVVKYDGRFGQYGFKGQAILFAQDLFEVSEKLPQMLSRSPEDAGIVVVTEHLENLNITRQFSISRPNVYAALQWLIQNNPLYRDVTTNRNVELNEQVLVRITQQSSGDTEVQEVNGFIEQQPPKPRIVINERARVINASWNQASMEIFKSAFAGVQCSAMALANIVKASIVSSSQWNTTTVDGILIMGDEIYEKVRLLTITQENAHPIPGSGYLMVRNFDVVKQDFAMYGKRFSIEYDQDPCLFGSLRDAANQDAIELSLSNSITRLLENHNAAILISSEKS